MGLVVVPARTGSAGARTALSSWREVLGLTAKPEVRGAAMIHPEDAQLHEPTSTDPLWGETNYFGLYVAGVPMNIGVYALFRTNVGVVTTNVSVNTRKVLMPWAADYWDAWAQTPIPESRSLLDYKLASGLHVTCLEPNKVWDVRYDDGGTLSLDFRYTALMDGFDIHDPAQDPMVAAQATGSDFSWGHAYSGHFDQTGYFEGDLVLRGQRYEIDCVSTMDHSPPGAPAHHDELAARALLPRPRDPRHLRLRPRGRPGRYHAPATHPRLRPRKRRGSGPEGRSWSCRTGRLSPPGNPSHSHGCERP
jgi:hypothetical protein